jgi:hypothetical protein
VVSSKGRQNEPLGAIFELVDAPHWDLDVLDHARLVEQGLRRYLHPELLLRMESKSREGGPVSEFGEVKRLAVSFVLVIAGLWVLDPKSHFPVTALGTILLLWAGNITVVHRQ